MACGGKGHVGYAFAGALAGGGLALVAVIPAVIAYQSHDGSLMEIAMLTGMLAPFFGAMFGYEFSSPPDPDSTTAPPIQLIPAISLSTDGRGGVVGIAGSF
jgi:ABC-type Mn2+/Zn2+ transport system permease subunit